MKSKSVLLPLFLILLVLISGCTAALAFLGTRLDVAKIENTSVTYSQAAVPVRIYTPKGPGPFPVLVYTHGGGWVYGSINTHDHVSRFLCNRAGCIVISVDYRLAPEYKFPAAVDDAYAALSWAEKNAARLNGDPRMIAAGGDSAGGNIASAVCLMARDRGGPHIIFQLLAFPATNLSTLDSESYRKFAKGYGLTKSQMEHARDVYLATEADRRNPYASPLLAKNLSKLPPAFIITGEFDVLRDDGEEYASRLKQAGVQVRQMRCSNTGHGAASWAIASDTVQDALDAAVFELRAAFEK